LKSCYRGFGENNGHPWNMDFGREEWKKVKMTKLQSVLSVTIVTLLLVLQLPANAATLDLTPAYPDLTTWSSSMAYDYTTSTPDLCFNVGGGPSSATGPCGTTSGNRDYSGAIAEDGTPGFGLFSITGSTLSLNIDGSANLGVAGGSYSLTADFDENGGFTGGSINVLGTTSDPDFQSGTLLTGNLFNFGFGGTDAAGIFEFEIDSLGGDMAAFGNLGGVIASTFNLATYGGNWDPLLDNNPAFWQQSFTASGNVDTFVPLPAAVWLFGSGLLGLAGFARRNKL
jgi:hypothetical protein